MIQYILEFNNHTYIKNISIKDVSVKDVSIKDLFMNTIDTIDINEFNKNIHNNNYYFIKDNKLLHPDSNIINDILNHNVNHIKCYRKQKGGILPGGGGGISGVVNGIINTLIDPIIGPIMAIADVFIALYKFLKWCGLFIYWCWFFAKWLFTDLLNPKHFIDDAFHTLQILIMTFFSSIFNIIMEILRFSVNIVGGWTQGFWGWDQSSLTAADRNSNYFKKMNKHRTKKCYLTNTNTVPFTIILGTVLCPPIGVFMDVGLSGWFYIFICIILTLFFYIPGLLYALFIIYS